MRIAHFTETEMAGGAEKLLVQLCLWAKSKGHTPVIIHFGFPYFSAACAKFGIEEVIIENNRNFKRFYRLVNFAFQFKKVLLEHQIDVLHSHLFGPIFGSALAARLAGVRHIGTLHDIYMIEEKPYRIRFVQWAALCGCKLVTVSKLMETFYRGRARFSAPALRTVYNTVQDPLRKPNKFEHTEFTKLRATPNTVICTFVGRLVSLKRCEDLIEAFEMITRKLGDEHTLFLTIAGDGPELESLKKRASTSNAASKILFLGRVKAVYGLLDQSDIYTQVSETEGLSLSILEAIASGLPAVLSRVGSNSELVDEGKNGYLVPTGNCATIAKALTTLYQSKAKRHTFAKASRAKYVAQYDYKTRMNEYLALYEGK